MLSKCTLDLNSCICVFYKVSLNCNNTRSCLFLHLMSYSVRTEQGQLIAYRFTTANCNKVKSNDSPYVLSDQLDFSLQASMLKVCFKVHFM